MHRVYAVLELHDHSTFYPSSDDDLGILADDLLRIAHKVSSVAVYPSLADLTAEERD